MYMWYAAEKFHIDIGWRFGQYSIFLVHNVHQLKNPYLYNRRVNLIKGTSDMPFRCTQLSHLFMCRCNIKFLSDPEE